MEPVTSTTMKRKTVPRRPKGEGYRQITTDIPVMLDDELETVCERLGITKQAAIEQAIWEWYLGEGRGE
jgi:hypothetical protein